jgi:3-dehydroquinate synthase
VITDEGVYRQARRVQNALEKSGIPTHLFIIPAGEQSKTLGTVQHIYTWLAGLKAERGHLILAVGGGVVGDLAGYVAATYLRGMPFAQVPTSLLAMMDASIGGKTGVDLPQGKNLVGAFYQPKFVLADVSTLRTLPDRELRSGWAEALKHGLIMDEDLLSTFEDQSADIQSLEPEIATDVIRRSMAIKANVVSQDERETLGIRVLLNYGHTIGHGIEAATGYGRFLHGEAVSIGMMGAANIGHALGHISGAEMERQRSALATYGLPLEARGVDPKKVAEAMRSDKKTSAGAIRWVLLDGIGRATTRNDVPPDLIRTTLHSLMN